MKNTIGFLLLLASFTLKAQTKSYNNETIVVSVVGQGANVYFLQAVTYYEPLAYDITVSEPILVKVQSTVNTTEINTYQISLLVPEPSFPSALRRMNLRRK